MAHGHYFVHFQEGGAASDVRTEDAGKEALKKSEVPVKGNPEALAKERTELIDRHGKVSKRIDRADKKLQSCRALIGNFFGGSELLQKAKVAYGEAEKTLARAKAKLPKIDVAAVVAKIPDAPKDTPEMADWKLKTKELPLPPEDQIALFQIEKNPDAAVVLYRQAETFGARNGMKVMDALKMLVGQVESFATRQGIKVSEALAVYLANDSASTQAQVPWPIFEKYFAVLHTGILQDKPGIIAVIMALYPHYDEKKGLPVPAATLMNKLLVRDGSLAAVKYVSDLRQLGLSPEQIIDYWDYKDDRQHVLRNAQAIRDLIHFQAQFPDLNNRFASAPRKFIDVGRFLNTQPPELQPFLIYVIKNTGSISVEELKTFTKDPSLPVAIEVYKKLGNPYNERNPLETALRLARSLYFQGARGPIDVPSNEVLIRQLYELKQLSARVAEWNLYGKEVVFVAGNDTYSGTSVPKFHSPEILDQLAVSAGRKVEAEKVEPNPSLEDLVALKQKILNRMKNAPAPMTMCFNGHADSNGLSLDMSSRVLVNGKYEYKPESYISPFELADVVKFRSNKFRNDPALSQDIYIFSACHSDELVRSVSGIIAAKGGVQPSFVSTSDFGLETTDGTERTAMQLGKFPAKVAGIQRNKDGNSNVTFYTPNSQGKLQQTVAG